MIPEAMTHDQALEVLEALAIDALEAFESAAALAHVAECEPCTMALAALREAAEQLAYAASPVAMTPAQRLHVRARLLARLDADRTESASAHVTRPIGDARTARVARRRPPVDPIVWGAVAAGVIAIVSLVAAMSARQSRDAARDAMQVARAHALTQRTALESLQVVIADRDRLIANLTGPQVAVMSLTSLDPQSPTARMFWDQQHDAWTFVAHHLTQPQQGRAYQLWLVTPRSKISAGTFTPRANGDAVVRATYKLDPSTLATVAVTEEPASGSPQPTTPPFLTVGGDR